MDLKYLIETEDGDAEIYLNASADDMDYLHRLALTFLLDNDMLPFKLLTEIEACNFHTSPEMIQ